MNKIKHLLPQTERYFKANLHTHSTISDGILTPVEVKEAYKAAGYQILCLTDHNTIELSDRFSQSDGMEKSIFRRNMTSG